MKTKRLLTIALIFFLTYSARADFQEGSGITDDIRKAISDMDATRLAGFFHSTINVEIIDVDGNFSSRQAEVIVQDFFKKHPVKSFIINHQGASNDGSKYMIGVYKSTNNKAFRVYIMMKSFDSKFQINKLQFEED